MNLQTQAGSVRHCTLSNAACLMVNVIAGRVQRAARRKRIQNRSRRSM